jgi:hypothetical protein
LWCRHESPSIRFLVEEIVGMNMENRARFLEFVTAIPAMPRSGLTIEVSSFSDHVVPRAHTCANQLHLPEYKTQEELHTGLMLAMDLERDGAFHEWTH